MSILTYGTNVRKFEGYISCNDTIYGSTSVNYTYYAWRLNITTSATTSTAIKLIYYDELNINIFDSKGLSIGKSMILSNNNKNSVYYVELKSINKNYKFTLKCIDNRKRQLQSDDDSVSSDSESSEDMIKVRSKIKHSISSDSISSDDSNSPTNTIHKRNEKGDSESSDSISSEKRPPTNTTHKRNEKDDTKSNTFQISNTSTSTIKHQLSSNFGNDNDKKIVIIGLSEGSWINIWSIIFVLVIVNVAIYFYKKK